MNSHACMDIPQPASQSTGRHEAAPSGLHRGGSQGSTKQATLSVLKWGVHPWHGARPLLCSSEAPDYPWAHLQQGGPFTSCVHTSCADRSASNVRLVAILGRTQSAHRAHLAMGVAGRRPSPAWVPTPTPVIPCTRQQTQAQGSCLQPSW